MEFVIHNWKKIILVIIGMVAVAIIVIGAVFTSDYQKNKEIIAKVPLIDRSFGAGVFAAPNKEIGDYRPEDYRYINQAVPTEEGCLVHPAAFADYGKLIYLAVLATEDADFEKHFGVSPTRIIAALLRNAGGGKQSGASTLTQQLVTVLKVGGLSKDDKTYGRKITEAEIALAWEGYYSKQQIFEAYGNNIYMGNWGGQCIEGLRQAAFVYFRKDLKQLSWAEAAHLAGAISSPGRFSPRAVKSAEATEGTKRRNWVLGRLKELGWISEGEYVKAMGEKTDRETSGSFDADAAPYVAGAVAARAKEEKLDAREFRFETTIDPDIQRLVVQEIKNRPAGTDVAVVVMRPQTGEVLAAAGTGFQKVPYNLPFTMQRQLGSAFKPFVYSAALREDNNGDGIPDWTPASRFMDEPKTFDLGNGQTYSPGNYGDTYSGQLVSLQTALSKSKNPVTVELFNQPGVAKGTYNITKDVFKWPSQNGKPTIVLSNALGTNLFSVIQVARGYSMFPAGGKLPNAQLIRAAVHLTNGERKEFPYAGVQTINQDEAELMCHLLEGPLKPGGTGAVSAGLYAGLKAGKSGTTQDNKDAWFIVFSPNLVVVVWLGKTDNSPMPKQITGGGAASPIAVRILAGSVKLRTHLGGNSWGSGRGLVERSACGEDLFFLEGTESKAGDCESPTNPVEVKLQEEENKVPLRPRE